MLKNKKEKTWLLIDMTLPLYTNTSVKTTEKLNECEDFVIEFDRIWGLKQQQSRWLWEPLAPSRRTWKTTPTKSLATSTLNEFQKITLLSAAHLLRRVLSIKKKSSCLPKSMVCTRMLREKITRNYTVWYILYNNNTSFILRKLT